MGCSIVTMLGSEMGGGLNALKNAFNASPLVTKIIGSSHGGRISFKEAGINSCFEIIMLVDICSADPFNNNNTLIKDSRVT